ncbi:hypothetical protein BDY19DRAFT_998324 [Irpex rosettiformis]|uniref:Uncharacterized protein n=1 Tax=Irpex rosettiformis TaxID=378272 RepID=A0ACB8TP13_9APHY|nr:hypothetical protein BDY19DRAFT_998324 [Irpex rosettiformis]
MSSQAKKIRANSRLKSMTGKIGAVSTTRKSLTQVAEENRAVLKKRTIALNAMPSTTRAAVSEMVEDNGAPPDDITWGAYSGMTAEEEGWMDIDEDEGPIDTSHEGGEYADSVKILISEITSTRRPGGLRSNARTRRERLVALRTNWKEQMPQLVDVYLQWKHKSASSATDATPCCDSRSSSNASDLIDGVGMPQAVESETRYFDVTAVWTHDRRKISVAQKSGEAANVSLIRQGLLGCAPIDPAFAFSLDTLELYHRLRRRHPQLGIQAMMRALCDVQEVNYLDSYREQLSIAFDAYLDILRRVQLDVDKALGRSTPHWRMKNACPCCNYKLKGEQPLIPSRLLAMDGNNSAKRVASAGMVDFSQFHSDYFLPREEVDRFKDEVKGRKRTGADRPGDELNASSDTEPEDEDNDAPWVPDMSKPGDVTDGQSITTSCTENWKASAEEHHKRALDIYHQIGIFGSACRHHFIEKFCEIIRSGELAKYPLAITNHTLDVHDDKDMTIGYDIGCAFTSTTNNSSLAGRIHARRLSFVTMFHILYKRGCGIEDLETMERIFSSSNNVARTIQYASQFHWAQALDLHFRQWDEEKYHELSKFLFNNYRQALDIIKNYTPEIERMKTVLQITDADIEGWLCEERQFLTSLKNEPEERVLEVSYVEALIARDKANAILQQATMQFRIEVPTRGVIDRAHNESATRHLETTRRNAMHAMTVAIQAVNELELKLDIAETWTPQHPQYVETVRYMQTRRFHCALDKVQWLVVQRLLEMTKANASGMSYKLRTSIGKAMKTRSKAIHTALKKYNVLASQMHPPAPVLQWKDVMNYAFVSEFDLLHHTYSHKDISQLPKYYKVKCVRDEILRLNVECRRLQTHIRDEEAHYLRVVGDLTPESPLLAAQVRKAYQNRRRVNRIHQVCLGAIHALEGYSGSMTPGIRLGHRVDELDDRGMQDGGPEGEQDRPEVPVAGYNNQIQLADRQPPDGNVDRGEQLNGNQENMAPDEELEHAAIQADMAGVDEAFEVAEDEQLNEEMEIINDFVEQLAVEPVQMRGGVPLHMMHRFRV